MLEPVDAPWQRAIDSPAQLGESPFWHPVEQCLYYCDIPAHRLYRWQPMAAADQALKHWQFDAEVASVAPFRDGSLMLAMRDGLWRFNPVTGGRQALAPPPYDPSAQRFNDGKCDPAGRFWVGSLDDRRQPAAALYRLDQDLRSLYVVADGITVLNGLGWSPDGRTLYWSDTSRHVIQAADFDLQTGQAGEPRVLASFAAKQPGQSLDDYAGRPDGAAVDVEGCYWVAMFEGQRLLRLSPQGEVLKALRLPVRCATMPCFGGADLTTLYLTTARHQRPEAELQAQPWAGHVLSLSMDVAGLPVSFCDEN